MECSHKLISNRHDLSTLLPLLQIYSYSRRNHSVVNQTGRQYSHWCEWAHSISLGWNSTAVSVANNHHPARVCTCTITANWLLEFQGLCLKPEAAQVTSLTWRPRELCKNGARPQRISFHCHHAERNMEDKTEPTSAEVEHNVPKPWCTPSVFLQLSLVNRT